MESEFHKPSSSAVARQTHVRCIRVEYDDGSSDFIELLQRGDLPLYGFTRARPHSQLPRGAYTAGGIAALLFKTAVTTQWTEYAIEDPQIAGPVRHCFGR